MASEPPTPISPISPTAPMSEPILAPEIEQTLARLSAYRNVRGVMILSRRAAVQTQPPTQANGTGGITSEQGVSAQSGGAAGILSSTGSVFEGESGRRYARAVEGIVSAAATGLNECDAGDELKLMRIRTKRHELIITPDEKYLLVVLQDPGS